MLKKIISVFVLVVAMGLLTTVLIVAQSPTFTPPATQKSADAVETYIVVLQGEPLATYRGGVAGLSATSPQLLGDTKLDVTSEDSVAYRKYLASVQAQALAKFESTVGHPVKVIYHYDVVLNGMALRLTATEAHEIKALPDVVSVQKEKWYYPLTDSSPAFIGADTIWNGSNAGSLSMGTRGEGVIVGVIDTGIWPEHPSFADDGSYPPPPAAWHGICQQPISGTVGYTRTYTCSNKLIGIRYFLDGYVTAVGGTYDGLFQSGRDDDGHGTHTASTAAGNVVTATLLGVNRGQISGIAPRAYVAAYKALGPLGGVTSDLVAAIDSAVADGVDVINYSIGSSTASDPWHDGDALAFLNAVDSGVFVSVSMGNSGPDAKTIGSPANAPWVTSIGASTSDRHFISDITLSGNGAPSGLYGASVTKGVSGYRLIDAEGIPDSKGDTSGMCLNPFNPGTFRPTDVVLCKRGKIARVLRGDYVKAGGGGGVILYNPVKQGLATDNYVIPAVHVENNVGAAIKHYITSTYMVTGTDQLSITPGILITFTQGTAIKAPDSRVTPDMMASFSSRGPNWDATAQKYISVVKPDVTAPGVQILAGNSPENTEPGAPGELYQAIQGTSMSSPHVAGAAALIKAVHPDWTPGQIRSALMMTAKDSGVVKEDGTTPTDPFDDGAGRIDLTKAAKAGIALDETKASYQNADPSAHGNPAALNLPSFGNAECTTQCVWTRTLQSVIGIPVSWNASATNGVSTTITVAPTSFTLNPGGTQVITVTADVSNLPYGDWDFGSIQFTTTATETVNEHMPVAVRSVTSNFPNRLRISNAPVTGTTTITDLRAIEITGLTTRKFGLTMADVYVDRLTQGDYALIPVTVVTNTKRFVSEIIETSAPDIDLYIFDSGFDIVCVSASGGSAEYCNMDDPTPGSYYVYVTSYAASSAITDTVQWTIGIVPDTDAGNLTVSGPSNQAANTPFDLAFNWDLSSTSGLYLYGAVDVGSGATLVGNLGTINVDLQRMPKYTYLPLIFKN